MRSALDKKKDHSIFREYSLVISLQDERQQTELTYIFCPEHNSKKSLVLEQSEGLRSDN